MKDYSLDRSIYHTVTMYKSCLVTQSVIIMARIRKHLPVLKKLVRCHQKPQQRTILKEGGKELLLCLSECALNITKGNVPLTNRQLKRLKKNKKHIRELSKKKTSLKKRAQIVQKGGFLPLLLAPIVGSVLGKLIGK